MNWTNNNYSSVYERYPDGLFMKRFVPSAFYLNLYAYPIWFIIGVIGNAISFFIWISRRQRNMNSSAVYLAFLALSDFFLIALMFVSYLKRFLFLDTFIGKYGFCQLFQGMYLFFQYYSIVLTFGFTLERWHAICFPFTHYNLNSTKRAIIGVLVLCVIVLIANSFYITVWEVYMDECLIAEAWQNETSFHAYITTNECIFSLLFPLATLIFNILVLREMRNLTNNSVGSAKTGFFHDSVCCSRKGNNTKVATGSPRVKSNSPKIPNNKIEQNNFHASTVMLIILSFYLIMCTLPAGIVFLVQIRYTSAAEYLSDAEISEDPMWKEYFAFLGLKEIIDFLCASHYACNFFIYLITGKAFRSQLFNIFSKKSYRKRSNFTSVKRRREGSGLLKTSVNSELQIHR